MRSANCPPQTLRASLTTQPPNRFCPMNRQEPFAVAALMLSQVIRIPSATTVCQSIGRADQKLSGHSKTERSDHQQAETDKKLRGLWQLVVARCIESCDTPMGASGVNRIWREPTHGTTPYFPGRVYVPQRINDRYGICFSIIRKP